MSKKAIVIGAGLVGSLWSIYLSRAGYRVVLYERRSADRSTNQSSRRSINLALSHRGWKALKAVGIAREVARIAIPLYGRIMHDPKGNQTYQPYGKEGQAIYSVSRSDLNALMVQLARDRGNTTIHYDHQCIGVDPDEGSVHLKNTQNGDILTDRADVLFAVDGAFSATRYHGMQRTDRFNYKQDYIDDGYRELLLPSVGDNQYPLEKNALHIWPRERFMLIALPNTDGSFTCTLFMPFEGQYSFAALKTAADADRFFKAVFPDFYALFPSLADNWKDYPVSSLVIIRCFPWTRGKLALMGDAAHATIPFYGQGMNCGFEDCTVMHRYMQHYGEDWPSVFNAYQTLRKPDGDALQDLSLHNYRVMRDDVNCPSFLLQQKIEKRFSERYPDKWMPLYSQVSFSSIRYSEALRKGMQQEQIMEAIMRRPDIASVWDTPVIEEELLRLVAEKDVD